MPITAFSLPWSRSIAPLQNSPTPAIMPPPTFSPSTMSFLAQLRQQHTPEQTGFCLCYFLRAQAGELTLALRLGEVMQGHLREINQPYRLQRQHLSLPPPFTSQDDVSVLRQLLAKDHGWVDRTEGTLNQPDPIWLEAMVATGRCFRDDGVRGAGLAPLSWGQSYESQPKWSIDTAGVQHLRWSYPAGAVPWCANPRLVLDRDQLRLGQANLSGDLLVQLLHHTPLSHSQLAEFFSAAAPLYEQAGLPLPQQLQVRECEAQFQPVLMCLSHDSPTRHELRLVWRYQTQDVGFVCDSGEDAAEFHFWSGSELLKVSRDLPGEQICSAQLGSFMAFDLAGHFEQCAEGTWSAERAESWRNLLIDHRSALEAQGFAVAFAPGFRHAYTAVDEWAVEVQQNGDQWQLGLSVIVGQERLDLIELLERLRLFNRNLVKDFWELEIEGRILLLPGDLCGALMGELEDLLVWYGSGGGIPNSQIYRLQRLQALLPEQTQWQGDAALLDRAAQLQKSPFMLDATASGVQTELRPYQWLGVCWLQHLKQLGFNGLLADDMGLGKTLQTLAHLSLEQRQGGLDLPALIVAPTSLLPNWAAELRRFCPHLRVQVLHGSQRHKQWAQHGVDILITSYPLLVRDLEIWRGTQLSWLVLDEAQVIKNAQTQVSQAVRQMQARHRLCLSGTPVENHLGELWSLLDFLEPGVLGTAAQFRAYYQKPIEQDGRADRLQQLLDRISPLLMRRTKNQVASELPAKTRIEQLIALGDEQRAFYERVKTESWQSLSLQLENTEHAGQKQMLVLAALMRLRQTCCDPQLLREHNIPSAKTEYCLDLLQALVAEGRAALVFSQFTSMLDLLAQRLDALGVAYLMLTGASRDRAHLVEQFQQGMAPVFLISLKAGGVGLNLTRADTVIHFDPWWNAAAEEQASDRAHRIGQTQPVFVYKLLAENTIEEKIARLQRAKAQLGQQINQQAQTSGKQFALQLEDLLTLWQDELDSGLTLSPAEPSQNEADIHG
jgi:superfamily II DNA or RNA helicase